MSNIQNLQSFDPWKDTEETTGVQTQVPIHLRVQQRTGRKRITIVEGLNEKKYNLKLILKSLKKEFHCNGNIEEDETYGKVIKLTGDKRADVKKFLIQEGIASQDNIKVHGS